MLEMQKSLLANARIYRMLFFELSQLAVHLISGILSRCVKLWQLVLFVWKEDWPPPVNSCHMDLNSDFPVFIRVCTFFAVIINLDDVGVHGSKYYLVVLLRWCYTGQLATPIRNACFSHEFADMLHFWIAFKNLQRVAALQISQKIVRNGVLH